MKMGTSVVLGEDSYTHAPDSTRTTSRKTTEIAVSAASVDRSPAMKLVSTQLEQDGLSLCCWQQSCCSPGHSFAAGAAGSDASGQASAQVTVRKNKPA